ncbi:MAG: transcriptional repressor [Synergistaceae bacterium]|nr:transcriptional repressor [Synergistaceae bacterium]
MERRSTIQKELILNTVRGLKTHVTADYVYENLANKYPSISRGTVYRNLNILCEEGLIKKVKTLYGADYFDFSLHDHYHVKCVSCGKISDVDMEDLPDILPKITDKHGYDICSYNLFFEGYCPNCRKEQK